MAKDLSKAAWHGVPRQDIPWYPTVEADACIGCELCYVTCGREVYDIALIEEGGRKAVAARTFNCMVGCSTCAVVCPTQAITFPSRDVVWKAEREHKIFKAVHGEAKERRDRSAALMARQKAEEQIGTTTTRAQVRIAGVFGDKRFLAQLETLIKERPFDIENLQLSVPTLKGLMDNTPAHMTFELASTTQETVQPMLDDLRRVVAENHLVWVE
jgi:ferredoxin